VDLCGFFFEPPESIIPRKAVTGSNKKVALLSQFWAVVVLAIRRRMISRRSHSRSKGLARWAIRFPEMDHKLIAGPQ